MTRDISDVRIVYSGEPSYIDTPPTMSPAEQKRAEILGIAEERLNAAREALAEGVEMMSVVMVPQHRNLDTLIGQLIAQIIEYRRVKQ